MYRQGAILKRKIFITLFIGTSILSGCGQSEHTKLDSVNPLTAAIDNPAEETNTKFMKALPKPLEIPINTQTEDIHYYSKDDIDLLRSMHRCVSDGKNIYLVHGEPDLYVMPIGTDKHYPANIDNPEGMIVCHITLDTYGRIHLLVGSNDNEDWFIWRLDENYQIDKKMDISTYFSEKQMPIWFLVDKDGTYYLQWLIERNGIIVDSEGELKHKFTLESLGTKWTYEAAAGKDGQIYLVHGHSREKTEIGKLNVKNCLIENVNPELYFTGNEVFSAMSGGTDTNLLLFSPYSGVWACDTENGTLENRVPLSEIGFSSNIEFWPLSFLPDGRLFLLGRTANENSSDDVSNESTEPLFLKYISVVK